METGIPETGEYAEEEDRVECAERTCAIQEANQKVLQYTVNDAL